MQKVKLNLERLEVESFPTAEPLDTEGRGTIIAYRPTFCPFTYTLPPESGQPPPSCY